MLLKVFRSRKHRLPLAAARASDLQARNEPIQTRETKGARIPAQRVSVPCVMAQPCSLCHIPIYHRPPQTAGEFSRHLPKQKENGTERDAGELTRDQAISALALVS